MRKSDYPKVHQRGVAGLVILLLLLLLLGAFAPAAMAADWPNCDWRCTANDTDVTRAWLGNCTTQANLSSCTAGTPVEACIFVNFSNTASTDRYQAFVLFDLYINYAYTDSIEKCVVDTIPSGDSSYDVYTLNWTCGDRVELRNFTLTWTTQKVGNVPCTCNNTSCCTGGNCTCKHQKSKCYSGNITVEAPLVANFTFDNVCFCTNTTFTDKTTGGNGSYSYDWDFDDGNSSNAQNPTHHYGKNGTYNVTLTVNDSDSPPNSDSQSYDVTVYTLPSCNITAPEAVCELSADGNASTNAGYANYSWVLSAGTITAGQYTDAITWTAPSSAASPVNISVTVIDGNNCTNTCYKNVTVYTLPSCNITALDAVCELSADGNASTNAGYANYSWVLSAGTITAGQYTDAITWTAPSSAASPVNISVTVIDANNCTNTCYKNVTVYTLPSCNITAPEAVCELSADGNASTNAGYANYSWVLSAGTITAGQYTDAITWTAPSSAASPVNISVTVIDGNNCTNTCYKNVTVYALPSCNITASDAVCELSADGNASTNAGYANYSWVLSAGTITAGQYTDAITWTAPSSAASPVNISVTVIDGNNCTNTCYKNVTVYTLPSCNITALDAVCELSADGNASTNAGYANYSWVLSAGTITAGQYTDAITWTAPSSAASPVNISVTVIDANNCTNTCYKNVTVYTLPSCNITAPEAVCELSADGNASTNAGYANYSWVLSAGTITAGQYTDAITWTAPSSAASPVNISVTVIDGNNCTNTCYKNVTVYALPSCNITASDAVCELSADGNASTNAGYANYSWVLSAGTITAGQYTDAITWTAPSSTASPVNISVTVIDGNNCTNTCYKNVTVYTLPSCNITALEAVCELSGGNNASTNAGYANYSWVLSAGTITAGQYTDAITWTAPSSTASPVNISVTVIDGNNCTNTCYKNVTVYALPSCNITALEAVCELSGGNNASTNAGYANYSWVLSAGTITAGQYTDAITWTAPSSTASPVNISVTVIDANNCTNTCYKNVTVYTLPSCNITALDAVCELSGGNNASTNAGYANYSWVLSAGTITAGQYTNAITWTAPSSAVSPVNISVTVIDANNCTNTCYKNVTVYTLPSCNITALEAVCELSGGNNASTNAGYANYSWVLSAGTITAGQYTNAITWTAPSSTASPVNISVTVIDGNNCTNTCYKNVTVYTLPSCNITALDAVCELSGGNNASTNAGYANYSWVLSAGTITAGQYTNAITWTAPSSAASPVNISVTVIDGNNCTNTCYKNVTVYTLPSCNITALDAVCELSADGNASTNAGYANYSWVLSAGTITAGQYTNAITWTAPSSAVSPVNISVTVIDANNCTNTCYKNVTVYTLPSCNITALEAVCELSGGNNASTNAGYANYSWVLSAGTITAGQYTNAITWTAPSSAVSPVNISVTVIDGNNCTNTCYKNVTVYTLPSCNITAPEAVCELSGGNNASTTAGYSNYTWALSAGTITAGQYTNAITWTAPSSTASPVNISVTVIDDNNCTNTCYKDVLVDSFKPSINIIKTAYPSSGAPSTNVNFTIVVTNTGDCDLVPVKVVDTLPGGMSYVSSSPTANTTGGTTIWDNVGPLAALTGSKTLYLVAHIDFGATGTLINTVNATGTPPAGDNVTDSDTATVVVHPKPKPPIPPITRPQQAQYFSEKSSVQGVGEIFYEKTILASGVGVREYMWGNTGNGTFAMTITEILNEGVRLNCSGNCSDRGKIMDPIYGDDESPVMTNFECKKMVQFEIGAKDNPLIYGLEGEAIYSNPGFSGGMNAQVNEYYAVSSLQKDETVKMTTTATYNDTKRDWTNCQKARPYNANELNFDTKNAFTGSWGTDSSWTKVCSKDIKHHQYFEGEFQVDKNLMFQEEVTKPWPEKEPHGDC